MVAQRGIASPALWPGYPPDVVFSLCVQSNAIAESCTFINRYRGRKYSPSSWGAFTRMAQGNMWRKGEFMRGRYQNSPKKQMRKKFPGKEKLGVIMDPNFSMDPCSIRYKYIGNLSQLYLFAMLQ